jgi:glycosyltransferase involved in cell wall biosynthesis
MMRICLFGDFDPAYSRNRVLKKGLQEAGAEVMLCVTKEKGIHRFSDLHRSYRALPSHDLVIVAYSDSRLMVPFARLISHVPVVWDAFYSLYDAFVSDRALISRANPKAWGYWLGDFVSAHLAHQILLDTDTHITSFAQAFFVPRPRFIKVLVGTDDALFTPVSSMQAHSPLVVGFYGKYIPLQGAEVIVRAAHLLAARSDIRFVMLGSGQTYAKVRGLAAELKADNIEFRPRISYEEFPALIASFDIALGIFGTTDKAARVIPNKVYDAMAMGKPIITSDTQGIRELLQHNHNAYLIPKSDPQALAAAIEALAASESLRASLGTHALETYRSHATPPVIGEGLLAALIEVLKPRLRIDFWLPHLKVAGGTKVTLTYASLLAKRGHRVRVCTPHRMERTSLWGGDVETRIYYPRILCAQLGGSMPASE